MRSSLVDIRNDNVDRFMKPRYRPLELVGQTDRRTNGEMDRRRDTSSFIRKKQLPTHENCEKGSEQHEHDDGLDDTASPRRL